MTGRDISIRPYLPAVGGRGGVVAQGVTGVQGAPAVIESKT